MEELHLTELFSPRDSVREKTPEEAELLPLKDLLIRDPMRQYRSDGEP